MNLPSPPLYVPLLVLLAVVPLADAGAIVNRCMCLEHNGGSARTCDRRTKHLHGLRSLQAPRDISHELSPC